MRPDTGRQLGWPGGGDASLEGITMVLLLTSEGKFAGHCVFERYPEHSQA
jgi:hypothetical protein